MNNAVVYLIGTSRKEGNTWKLLHRINEERRAPVIDLTEYNISYFDYDHQNINDDFLPLVERLLQYRTIGFVSPLYWYTVSAQMKTFMDRLSDLLHARKEFGKALIGKSTFLIATGCTEERLPRGMEETIRLTSEYLRMSFQGSFYAQIVQDLQIPDEHVEAGKQFVAPFFSADR